MQKIYYLNTEVLNDQKIYLENYSKVSLYRKEKIDGLACKKDKNLCLGAGILTKLAFKELNIDEDKIKFYVNEYGKPYIESENFYFNIAHSGDYAVLGIASNEIGIDIEKNTDINLDVAKRFFSEEEYEIITSYKDKKEQEKIFLTFWAIKESYAKCLGMGLKIPFNKIKINYNAKTVKAEGQEELKFSEIKILENYSCFVCAKEIENSIEIKKIKL